MIFLEHISFLSLVGAVVIGLWYFNKSAFPFRIIISLLVCGLIVDLINRFLQPYFINGKFAFNLIWYLCEFLLIVMFYDFAFTKKYGFLKFCGVWVFAYCILSFTTNALNVYNPGLRLMMSVPLVLISTWGLYRAVRAKDLAVGIVSIGFVLYFLVTVPVFLYFNEINRSIWVVHSILNIIMNTLIGLGIYHEYKSRISVNNNHIYNRSNLHSSGDSVSRL